MMKKYNHLHENVSTLLFQMLFEKLQEFALFPRIELPRWPLNPLKSGKNIKG